MRRAGQGGGGEPDGTTDNLGEEVMDIQETLRRYGRDSRLLGAYRAEFNALDIDDPKWLKTQDWLKRIEQDVNTLEESLVAAGLMHDSDRYMYREGK